MNGVVVGGGDEGVDGDVQRRSDEYPAPPKTQ
jgi:hypothetical protein